MCVKHAISREKGETTDPPRRIGRPDLYRQARASRQEGYNGVQSFFGFLIRECAICCRNNGFVFVPALQSRIYQQTPQRIINKYRNRPIAELLRCC